MKFEREIPIGLDARQKKMTGGGHKGPPPPHGIRVKNMRKIEEHHHISLLLGDTFKDNEGIYAY